MVSSTVHIPYTAFIQVTSSLTNTVVVSVNNAVVDDIVGDVAMAVMTTRSFPLDSQTPMLLVLSEPHMLWGSRNYMRTMTQSFTTMNSTLMSTLRHL